MILKKKSSVSFQGRLNTCHLVATKQVFYNVFLSLSRHSHPILPYNRGLLFHEHYDMSMLMFHGAHVESLVS